jgi:hypothetical protein
MSREARAFVERFDATAIAKKYLEVIHGRSI